MYTRNWDNHSIYDYQLVKNPKNIFAPDTLEYLLVNCVIQFFKSSNYEKLNVIFSQNTLEQLIVQALNNKQYSIFPDSNYIFALAKKSLWLSVLSECLELVKMKEQVIASREAEPAPLFGLFLETGLNDLWLLDQHVANLTKYSPNPTIKQHLLDVAKFSSQFRQDIGLPYLETTYLSDGKIDYTLHNMGQAEHYFKNIDYLKFPIQTWPDVHASWVRADTRGTFHHLGDDIAFVLAALKFGDVCFLGNDEFGNVLVLHHVAKNHGQKSTKLQGKSLNRNDFAYIYGVPRTNAFYPTKKNPFFSYGDDNWNHCQTGTIENCKLSNRYWESPVFLKYANRPFYTTNLTKLAQQLRKTVTQALSDTKKKNIFQELKTLGKLIYSSSSYSNHLLVKEHFNNSFSSIDLSCENQFIQENFSLFLKTIAHKAHCTVINPRNEMGLGFFKKTQSLKEQARDSTSNTSLLTFVLQLLLGLHCTVIKSSHYIKDSKMQSLFGLKRKTLSQLWNNPVFWQLALFNIIEGQMDLTEKTLALYYYPLFNYWLHATEDTFVCSDLISMQFEYRIFVINHKPVTGSPCFRNTTPFNTWNKGIFDPHLADGHNAYDTVLNANTRKIVASYAKFSRQFTQEVAKTHPESGNYVLDVCLSKNSHGDMVVAPVEINSINYSGPYQIDFRKLCAAITHNHYSQYSINQLGLDYPELLKKLDSSQLLGDSVEQDQDLLHKTDDETYLDPLVQEALYSQEDNDSLNNELYFHFNLVKKAISEARKNPNDFDDKPYVDEDRF